jgi:hypothetical protein
MTMMNTPQRGRFAMGMHGDISTKQNCMDNAVLSKQVCAYFRWQIIQVRTRNRKQD